MGGLNKKGVSQYISSGVLLGIIITAGYVVYEFGIQEIQQSSEKQAEINDIKSKCIEIDFNIDQVYTDSLDELKPKMMIQNKGTVDINGFFLTSDVEAERAWGATKIRVGESKEVSFDGLTKKLSRADVLPFLTTTSGLPVVCSEKGKTVQI